MELLKELHDLLRHPAVWRGDQLAQTTVTDPPVSPIWMPNCPVAAGRVPA